MAASIVGFSFARFMARDWVSTGIPARFRKYDEALARRAFPSPPASPTSSPPLTTPLRNPLAARLRHPHAGRSYPRDGRLPTCWAARCMATTQK
jgi:hypothetical protein